MTAAAVGEEEEGAVVGAGRWRAAAVVPPGLSSAMIFAGCEPSWRVSLVLSDMVACRW